MFNSIPVYLFSKNSKHVRCGHSAGDILKNIKIRPGWHPHETQRGKRRGEDRSEQLWCGILCVMWVRVKLKCGPVIVVEMSLVQEDWMWKLFGCDLIHPLTNQINILISQLENHLAVSVSLSVAISVISLPVDNFDQNKSAISYMIKKKLFENNMLDTNFKFHEWQWCFKLRVADWWTRITLAAIVYFAPLKEYQCKVS